MQFFESRTSDIIISVIVVIYTLLIFLYMSFSKQDIENNSDFQTLMFDAQIIEMVILSIFIIEITLKVYSIGASKYFSDRLLIFDLIVIVLSIGLIIITWVYQDERVLKVANILRTIFRFLRLFLVFRKVPNKVALEQFSQVRRFTTTQPRYQVKAPVEKILTILQDIQKGFEDQEIIEQLKWTINKIS